MGEIYYPDPEPVAVAAWNSNDQWGWATTAQTHGLLAAGHLDQGRATAADAYLAAFAVVLNDSRLHGCAIDLLCTNRRFRETLTAMRHLAPHVEPLPPDRFSTLDPVLAGAIQAAKDQVFADAPLLAACDGSLQRRTNRGGIGWVSADGQHAMSSLKAVSVVHTELAAMANLLDKVRTDTPLVVFVDSREALTLARRARDAHHGYLPDLNAPVQVTRTLQALHDHLNARDVQLRWVAGHQGHPLNEGAHRLANLARRAASMTLPAATVSELRRRIVADTVQQHAEALAAPSATAGDEATVVVPNQTRRSGGLVELRHAESTTAR